MILLLIAAILPHDTAIREHVDALEVQDFYSWSPVEHENGDVSHELKFVFTQILFRKWNDRTLTHEIEAWRMAKPGMDIHFVNATGLYEFRFEDSNVSRIVTTRSLSVTSSDFDSELNERSTFPKEHRRDLLRRKAQ